MTSAGPQDEVSLEDIDKILAQEDPDFTKSLDEVRSVEIDKSVVIESAAIDETMVGDDVSAGTNAAPVGFLKRSINKLRAAIATMRANFKARVKQFGKDAIIFLKTRPIEFAKYSFVLAKTGFTQAKIPTKAFAAAPRVVQLAILVLLALVVGTLVVFKANLKGIWLPHLNDPILANLADHADFVEDFDPQGSGLESFYTAFPQELHEFLFKKMKVNLRRKPENPNPMGAFEVVVGVDSKDTAVELHDREIEFHDMLQRLFEEELVTDLDGETGKKILKGRIRKELNGKLTQGWIKEVHFKTFVLKP